MKPTNEALRAWAAKQLDWYEDYRTIKVSVPEWGVVHLTDRAAFVEAVIEIPLDENGGIADDAQIHTYPIG